MRVLARSMSIEKTNNKFLKLVTEATVTGHVTANDSGDNACNACDNTGYGNGYVPLIRYKGFVISDNSLLCYGALRAMRTSDFNCIRIGPPLRAVPHKIRTCAGKSHRFSKTAR